MSMLAKKIRAEKLARRLEQLHPNRKYTVSSGLFGVILKSERKTNAR